MAEILTNGNPAKNSDVKMEEGSQKIVPQKAGLEDIVAATSEICFIDGKKGRLVYRGYDVHDLSMAARLLRKSSTCCGMESYRICATSMSSRSA
jgi:citrate synthase (EC 2.3.3.1)